MLTGVWGGYFYVVAAGISFYIRVVDFCFDYLRYVAFKVICRWCFCFYYCFVVERILLLPVCSVDLDQSIQLAVSKYVRLSRLRRVTSRKRAW